MSISQLRDAQRVDRRKEHPMETYYDPADLAKFSADGIGEGAP